MNLETVDHLTRRRVRVDMSGDDDAVVPLQREGTRQSLDLRRGAGDHGPKQIGQHRDAQWFAGTRATVRHEAACGNTPSMGTLLASIAYRGPRSRSSIATTLPAKGRSPRLVRLVEHCNATAAPIPAITVQQKTRSPGPEGNRHRDKPKPPRRTARRYTKPVRPICSQGNSVNAKSRK